MNRKWKIYLLHHTHTDIGYTDRQEKIERYHTQFINQAVRIQQQEPQFKWVCETFWAVEQFLYHASAAQREAFEAAVQAGRIELTANYLNMTELPDFQMVSEVTKRAAAYGQSLGMPIKSAMIADVNGYSKDCARALCAHGVENLLACVHTHHGMYPARRKQYPFWWEIEPGKRLLVWNAEHYMIGNDLGLVPDALQSYLIKDEFVQQQDRLKGGVNEAQVRKERVFRYLQQLETEDYPYSFIPVTLAGMATDNAAPNGEIVGVIQDWNRQYGDQIELEMSTVTAFFEQVRKSQTEIPLYAGEWPDWWSDGYASTPGATALFREGQRNLQLALQLREKICINRTEQPSEQALSNDVFAKHYNKALYSLLMYAEHTWGHAISVSEPFSFRTNGAVARKAAYAAEGTRQSSILLDEMLVAMGEAELYPGRPRLYKVFNPHTSDIRMPVRLYIDGWEIEKAENNFQVRDEHSGERYPYQLIHEGVGKSAIVILPLRAGEERILRIITGQEAEQSALTLTLSSTELRGSDGIIDVKPLRREEGFNNEPNKPTQRTIRLTEHGIETAYVRIEWKYGKGIVSWLDKQRGCELILQSAEHQPFTPVYEITKAPSMSEQADTRRRMGRNRKGANVIRNAGGLVQIKVLENGPIQATVELIYEVEGFAYYGSILTVYADLPRVDVALHVQKNCVWDAENVYIALPFTAGSSVATLSQGRIWIDKGMKAMQPWEDQIYGTCTDFYTVQSGAVILDEQAGNGVAVAMPDTPLVQIGSLEYGERLLSGDPELTNRSMRLYSWVMSNYWETNFKASLEGFYEFKYRIAWGTECCTVQQAIETCRIMNLGTPVIRIVE